MESQRVLAFEVEISSLLALLLWDNTPRQLRRLAATLAMLSPVESRGPCGDVVHQGHPLREVARVREAPRMTTLFAPALRTACRSKDMSATL
jgi:hypothetical protein